MFSCCDKDTQNKTEEELIYLKGDYIFRDENKYEVALVWANRALEINPKYKEAYKLKINCLHTLGRHLECIECAQIAVQIDPNFEEALIKRDC